MRILLVEDDPVLRGQLAASLQDAGYAVDVADNGRDAQFLACAIVGVAAAVGLRATAAGRRARGVR